MKRRNATRNALFTSILSLLLCVSMLVGATFAWFTDTVSSGLNTITAGNLDIELEYSKDATAWASVKDKTDLFSGALWEPGHTEVVYLRLSNKGTLALNYQLGINVAGETEGINVAGDTFKLSDHIKFGVVEGQSTEFADRAAAVAAVSSSSKKLNEGYTKANSMVAGAADAYLALVVYMPESVGNEANYRGTAPTINLGINVLATQKAEESDSFGSDYDQNPGSSVTPAPDAGVSAAFGTIEVDGEAIASYDVPKGAVDPAADEIVVAVSKTTETPNFTVAADMEVQPYEVRVSGLKVNNDVPVKVQLRIPAGKDPATVKLYHHAVEIPCSYNPTTGWVTFESTTFSPFFVVYDADSVYDAPEIPEGAAKPQASVVATPEYVNVALPWGSYGQWSPTAGLDANLEAAYKFSVTETLEQAKTNPYANWYCDFYVSLDEALGENEIFLGGNYGSFGWVGFHNGELTLDANTEIPLLGSVTSNPWTYLDVVQNVGTFICGVGDVNDALADATFTVKLRLTNPADDTDFFDVAAITHTFTKVVNSGEELQDAIENGNTNIELGGDIDLSNGLVIPGN